LPADFHQLVREGDLAAVRAQLAVSPNNVNAYNRQGHTALMVAVQSAKASVELVALLIEKGARVDDVSKAPYETGPVLALAIKAGDLEKVSLLIDKGADPRYKDPNGYNALVDAAYGANYLDRPRLCELLRLLIASGSALRAESDYGETAIGVFSRFGRFDAIQVLLDAGMDTARLGWNPLHQAVALGSLGEVRRLIDEGADIEARDHYKSTPFLLAAQTGDVEKGEFLLQRGANSRAVGHCGIPALSLAIESHRQTMVQWLLRIGADVEQTDEFGNTALRTAVEYENSDAVRALLAHGAKTETQTFGETPLAAARNRDIILQLLQAGADITQLKHEGQRILIGLGEISEEPLLNLSKSEFLAGCSPRFGTSNPEKMTEPFWVGAYQGAQVFDAANRVHPIWCAQRFGQSLTRLPDGRVIQIAGEHEDSYDADFYIYNDVFVHRQDGTIEIYGYPEDVFPPTDFHTATLIGKYIYVIGSMGYPKQRRFGTTQVFRLDTESMQFERMEPGGEAPGWISSHRAAHVSANEIRVKAGTVVTHDGKREMFLANDQVFVLDIAKLVWRRN
jgi:ankyrin repeat protein